MARSYNVRKLANKSSFSCTPTECPCVFLIFLEQTVTETCGLYCRTEQIVHEAKRWPRKQFVAKFGPLQSKRCKRCNGAVDRILQYVDGSIVRLVVPIFSAAIKTVSWHRGLRLT